MGKALRNIVKVVRNINTGYTHSWNSTLPAVPRQAAIVCLQRRRRKKLLLTKGSVSHYGVCHLPEMLGPLADGGILFFAYVIITCWRISKRGKHKSKKIVGGSSKASKKTKKLKPPRRPRS
jgi:hypothetical protein